MEELKQLLNMNQGALASYASIRKKREKCEVVLKIFSKETSLSLTTHHYSQQRSCHERLLEKSGFKFGNNSTSEIAFTCPQQQSVQLYRLQICVRVCVCVVGIKGC